MAREILYQLLKSFHLIFNQAVQWSKRAKITLINRDTHCPPGYGCPAAGTKEKNKTTGGNYIFLPVKTN